MLIKSLHIFRLLLPVILTAVLYSCGSETRNSETAINTNFIEENAGPETNRLVYILPLENKADPAKYRNTALIQSILFNSFDSFVPYLPGINVPEKSALLGLKPGDAETVSNGYKPDFIVYGSYILTGNRSNPTAVITIRVMSGTSGKSFSNTYSAPTDVELFDSIDRIIEDLGSFIMKEKTRVAHINFADFKTGPYKYDLRVNGRMVATVTNSSFSLGLNVLAGKNYHVELERILDSKDLIDENVVLDPGGSTNISYRENIAFKIDSFDDLYFMLKKPYVNRTGSEGISYRYILNNNIYLHVDADPGGKMSLDISDRIEKDGRKSLHFKGRDSGWEHLIIPLAYGTNISILRFWIYSASDFNNPIAWVDDFSHVNYYCRYPEELHGGKWIQVSIPLKNFKFRRDYQDTGAKFNDKINLPLSSIRPFIIGGFFHNTGSFDVYLDSFELVE